MVNKKTEAPLIKSVETAEALQAIKDTKIPTYDFKGIRDSQIPLFTDKQIAKFTKAQFEHLTAAHIAKLGDTQVAAITPKQIGWMRPDLIEALYSKKEQLSEQSSKKYKIAEIVSALEKAHLEKAHIEPLTPEIIKAIPEDKIKYLDCEGMRPETFNKFSKKQMKNFCASQLATAHPDTQKEYSRKFPHSPIAYKFYSPQQINALLDKKDQLSEEHKSVLSFRIVTMKAEEFKELDPKAINFIKPQDMDEIDLDVIPEMTLEQTKALSENQVHELYHLRIEKLTEEQRTLLSNRLSEEQKQHLETIKLEEPKQELEPETPAPKKHQMLTPEQIEATLAEDIIALEPATLIPVLKHLSAEQINAMSIRQIEAIPANKMDQLNLKDVETTTLNFFSPEQIAGLSEKQAKDLTVKQINGLYEKQIQAIPVDRIPHLAFEGLDDGILTAFKPGQVSKFTEGQISSLEAFKIDALSEEQIQAISEDSIKGVKLGDLDEETLNKFTNSQVGLFSEEQISSLQNWQIDALSEERIQAISEDSIKGLKLGDLDTETLKKFTNSQVDLFSEEQISSLQQWQIDELTPGSAIKARAAPKESLYPETADTIKKLTEEQVLGFKDITESDLEALINILDSEGGPTPLNSAQREMLQKTNVFEGIDFEKIIPAQRELIAEGLKQVLEFRDNHYDSIGLSRKDAVRDQTGTPPLPKKLSQMTETERREAEAKAKAAHEASLAEAIRKTESQLYAPATAVEQAPPTRPSKKAPPPVAPKSSTVKERIAAEKKAPLEDRLKDFAELYNKQQKSLNTDSIRSEIDSGKGAFDELMQLKNSDSTRYFELIHTKITHEGEEFELGKLLAPAILLWGEAEHKNEAVTLANNTGEKVSNIKHHNIEANATLSEGLKKATAGILAASVRTKQLQSTTTDPKNYEEHQKANATRTEAGPQSMEAELKRAKKELEANKLASTTKPGIVSKIAARWRNRHNKGKGDGVIPTG